MSSSETESEPELPPASFTTPATFARLSAAKHSPETTRTVQWAIDTLAMLDFRTIRKDVSLHHIIQDCASTLLDFIHAVLNQPASFDADLKSLILNVTSIFNPSLMQLLFQYRRLFHFIAMNDIKPGHAVPTIVCWVDVLLAKLGDLSAFLAAGFHSHPDQTLPDTLKARRQEDNIRAACQLPDTWDMAPSLLPSERTSPAAKRLTIRLMFGQHVLHSHPNNRDLVSSARELLLVLSEYVQQSAAQLLEAAPATELGPQQLIQQERLTHALMISLFAAADLARSDAGEVTSDFRPHTVASVMRLLRFVLYAGEGPTQPKLFHPIKDLDAPTSVIMLWEIVPQWTWTIWLEYPSLYSDVNIRLTATYLHHRKPGSQTPEGAVALVPAESGVSSIRQRAMINVVIQSLSRFIAALSPSPCSAHLPTILRGALHEACALVARWVISDALGIRNSVDCCKTLITLVPCLSLTEQDCHTNDLVIESLTSMQDACLHRGWQATLEDDSLHFPEIMGEAFSLAKRRLSQNDFDYSQVKSATQLMQFFTVMISKGVKLPHQNDVTDFIDAVGEYVLETLPPRTSNHSETFITCLAIINRHQPGLSFNRSSPTADCEAIWKLGMSGNSTNLVLSAAFSSYITAKQLLPDPLTCLEAWDHLMDMILLICSHDYDLDDEPLALVFCPTICDALSRLFEHCDDIIASYMSTDPRTSALQKTLKCLQRGLTSDRYFTLLKHRLSGSASRLLHQLDFAGKNDNDMYGKTTPEKPPEISYKPIFCRHRGISHIFFVPECTTLS